MSKVKLYYVITFFWAMATSLGGVIGAGAIAGGYLESAREAGQAGHPTPLAFFLPLLGIVFFGVVSFLAFDVAYACAALPPGAGRFKHAAGNFLFYILAVAAVPFILAAMNALAG